PFSTELPATKTTGVGPAVAFAAAVASFPVVTMRSTLARNSCATSGANRSGLPIAYRSSTAKLLPSTYPSACKPSRKESRVVGKGAGASHPMRYTFAAVCASAVSGATRILPTAMVMNARRSISLRSLDDFVGPYEDGLWDCEPESLRSFQVHD